MYDRIAQRLCAHFYCSREVLGSTLAHADFFLPLILIRGVRMDWISVLVRPSPSKWISTRTILSSVHGVRAFSLDSVWTPHGLKAPIMQGSVPCWQPASPHGLAWNTWGTVKTSTTLANVFDKSVTVDVADTVSNKWTLVQQLFAKFKMLTILY
jgi:hypothetical protein